VAGPRSQGVKIGAAAALAVLGFGVSFGLARMTDDGGAANSPTQAEQASIAALPPEAARLVRLSPAAAVPALRAAPTTVAVVAPQPAPSTRTTPTPQPEPTPTTAPQPAPEPEPTPTTAPPATTYIP
jgi:hypothetical protein